jgi:TIR domain
MSPATPQLVDLASIAQNAAIYPGADGTPRAPPTVKEYDVFVSHATEDKESIVRPLALALQAEGLRVWYDEFELRLGVSLGVASTRVSPTVGVVVLSEPFFRKGWTNYELDGLATREMSQGGGQLIL